MSAAFARQNEPSMDDILASIRKIISDDIGGAAPTAAELAEPVYGAPVLELLPESALSRPSVDWHERASQPNDGHNVQLREQAETVGRAHLAPMQPQAEPQPVVVSAPIGQAASVPQSSGSSFDQTVESQAERAVSAAFSSLRQSFDEKPAPQFDLSSASQLLVEATLRPMLKEWLDAHLPAIVERLVSAEIERMARRG